MGGNAVDAAIATAFAQGVTNPLACGLGGIALFLVHDMARGVSVTIHGSARIGSGPVPARIRKGYLGRAETVGRHLVEDDLNQFGHLSVMVPGFIAAAAAAFESLGSGRVSWGDLLEPAIKLAIDGFVVYPYAERYYWFAGLDRPGYPDAMHKLTAPQGAKHIYLRNGRYYRTGEILRQEEYGRTLQRLAGSGASDFYKGAIAREIADDFRMHDGLLTAQDLTEYEAHTDTPITGTYRGYQIMSTPPPSHGVQIIQMLHLLESFDLRALGWNTAEYVDLLSRSMCSVFADSAEFLGDPAFFDVPIKRLVSKEHALTQAKSLRGPTSSPSIPAPENTTHTSVVDGQGCVVSLTHSIGSVAGAGFVTPGLGFLWNNLLGHFSPLPGRPDSIVRGKRMDGGAPTIVLRDGRPFAAIGSSGGSRLISAIVQTLVNVIDHGMPIQQAVSVPRFHSERPGHLVVEAEIAAGIGEELRGRGFDLTVSQYMGCNQAVVMDAAREERFAGTDPRGGQGVDVAE